ncbi:hypothetical protein BOX15_Mlig004725g3 [Macrostomum lignano]|uniref:Uncharacterized protein n=2 Tax=Macrostomum lignano TaxID=282301 RepID=A0A267DM26_9PLAT|nr:hypothetical protein BOX15_Mlig004725g3 [Macrostomum lignano]
MDAVALNSTASIQRLSPQQDGQSCVNGEFSQKWSLEPSLRDSASSEAVRSSGEVGNQYQEQACCMISGPLKVRLKRQKQPTEAVSTKQASAKAPDVTSLTPARNKDDPKAAESMVDNSSQTEPNKAADEEQDTVFDSADAAPRGSKAALNGIVWLETPGSLLVLRDVIWRGRRYVGALLPEEAAPVPTAHSKTARRRSGRRRRRQRRLQDRQQRRECQPLACSQTPLLPEMVSKVPLLTEQSCDGSVVYRISLKRPQSQESCSKTSDQIKMEDGSKQLKLEESSIDEAKSEQVNPKDGAGYTADCNEEDKADNSKSTCAYSDISDDDETAVPAALPPGAPGTALSPFFTMEFHPSVLAAYARCLLEQQQRLIGMLQ